MKKYLPLFAFALAASALPLTAQDAEGTVSYALPQTVLVFDVEARQDVFYAGPLARYAKKYLGVEAPLQDKTSYTVTSVKFHAAVEADQSGRYSVALVKSNSLPFLQMTTQGLVAGENGAFGDGVWKYPSPSAADFVTRGLPANLTTESSTLVGRGMESVSQSVIVEKSAEKKAQEVASKIFKIRDQRYKILVGDTDATYSGEAMKAAVDGLARMEQDYLTLFTGYTVSNVQTATFEVLPKSDSQNHLYVAFRLSDIEGLQGADNVTGRPYYIELKPEPVPAPMEPAHPSKAEQQIHYRIPAICDMKLTDGIVSLLQTRVPVYQLGLHTTYPIVKTK